MSEYQLHKATIDYLKNHAAVSPLVGSRFHPSEAKDQKAGEAYVVYDQIGNNDPKTHRGDQGTPTVLIEFKIYAPSPSLRLLISDALKLAFDEREKRTISGVYVGKASREYVYDSKAEVTGEDGAARTSYRRLVNFRIQWQTKPA